MKTTVVHGPPAPPRIEKIVVEMSEHEVQFLLYNLVGLSSEPTLPTLNTLVRQLDAALR